MKDVVFEPRLAERIQKQYKMKKPPVNLTHLIEHVRTQVLATPGAKEQITSIRTGKVTIGQTDSDRGQSIVAPDGREVRYS